MSLLHCGNHISNHTCHNHSPHDRKLFVLQPVQCNQSNPKANAQSEIVIVAVVCLRPFFTASRFCALAEVIALPALFFVFFLAILFPRLLVLVLVSIAEKFAVK